MILPVKVTCILWTTSFSTMKKFNNQDFHYPAETGVISVISIYRSKYNSNCLPQFALPQVWFGSLLFCRTVFSLMHESICLTLFDTQIYNLQKRKRKWQWLNRRLLFFLIHVICLLYSKHCELCWTPLIDCMLLSKPTVALKFLIFFTYWWPIWF